MAPHIGVIIESAVPMMSNKLVYESIDSVVVAAAT